VKTDARDACATADADSRAYARAWRETAAALEPKRLQALRQLSELEAAQRFARLLAIPLPYPLREGSGLVEQQRFFDRLRKIRR
jgi:hypothetical protein